MIGIWFTISVRLDASCLWLTVVAVIEIALILNFTGLPAGWFRFFGIFVGTIIILVASQWLIAALAFGLALGLLPHESAQQIGTVLAWEFSKLRFQSSDWIWIVFAVLLNAWLGLSKRKPKS